MVAIATNLSAFFILAANSWMQHPVGFQINPERGRAELTSLWAVLNNSTNQVAYPHVATASFLTAAAFVIGVSAWHLYRKQHVAVMRESLKMGFVVALLFGVGVTVTGDLQAKVMTEQQPMKMAAAEAIWDTQAPASFSVFTIGTPDGQSELFSAARAVPAVVHGDRATPTVRSRGSGTSSASPRSGSAPATTGRSSR